jgi:hypothetical protein
MEGAVVVFAERDQILVRFIAVATRRGNGQDFSPGLYF